MTNVIALPKGLLMDKPSTPVVIPAEAQEQVLCALEQLLENVTFTANGQHFEIGRLETDLSHPEYMGIKVHFRSLSPVVSLGGKPA
jgi:hypothetical protein